MPRAKRKQQSEQSLEFISLDGLVSDGSPMLYVNVKGGRFADQGIADGDLVVLQNRPAKDGEMMLVRIGDDYDLIRHDEPETRRQKFYIVGKGPSANLPKVQPDETLGVIAYVLRRMTKEVQYA